MVKTHIPLVVRHVDLDDDELADVLALNLSELGWRETGGQVIATVYTDEPDPVEAAAAAAHHIKRVLPHAVVERVDEQFVSLSDIAGRAGLSHEAVRLWAAGKRRGSKQPFPTARAQVGQGQSTTKIWAWPEVLAWLKVQYCLDLEPGVAYLTPHQNMTLNTRLHEAPPRHGSPGWRPASTAGVTRTLQAVDATLSEVHTPGRVGRRFTEATGRR